MNKFERSYIVAIEDRDGTMIRIRNPFTVEFDIHRNSFSSANVASIRLYNLNSDTRNKIRKDQYDFGDIRNISFVAGYGNSLSLAFEGTISQAWSVREGTDYITQIESYDGGFAYVNAITSSQFSSGTPQNSIIRALIKNLPGVTLGAVGDYAGEISRGNSYSGSTTNILSEITNGGFFIDNGKAYVLQDEEALSGNIPTISAKTGLLGTPILEQQNIQLKMLFEPGLRVAQLVKLESQTETRFNGIHKVISLKHTGMISDSVAGTATTTVGLLPGVFTTVDEESS